MEVPLDDFQPRESDAGVEVDRIGFRIDDDADAAVLLRHLQAEQHDVAQERLADALTFHSRIDSESGEAQHRQGVARQLSPESRRQTLALQLAGRDRRVAHDALTVDGNIGCTDVMTELVLAGVLGEEAIEVGVIRAKGLAVGQTPGVA